MPTLFKNSSSVILSSKRSGHPAQRDLLQQMQTQFESLFAPLPFDCLTTDLLTTRIKQGRSLSFLRDGSCEPNTASYYCVRPIYFHFSEFIKLGTGIDFFLWKFLQSLLVASMRSRISRYRKNNGYKCLNMSKCTWIKLSCRFKYCNLGKISSSTSS